MVIQIVAENWEQSFYSGSRDVGTKAPRHIAGAELQFIDAIYEDWGPCLLGNGLACRQSDVPRCRLAPVQRLQVDSSEAQGYLNRVVKVDKSCSGKGFAPAR